MGIIVRDDKGTFKGAVSQAFSNVASAIQIEALALRAALALIVMQRWTDVDVETDCALLLAAVLRTDEDSSEIGRIVEDCRDDMMQIPSIVIRHTFREANGVAHRLAHLAKSHYENFFWFDEAPASIQDVLFIDECNVSSF